MTESEYRAFANRCLDTHDWQNEQPELADAYREYYVSGGWNEGDLATLVTLHMLYEFLETLDNPEPEFARGYCALTWKIPAGQRRTARRGDPQMRRRT